MILRCHIDVSINESLNYDLIITIPIDSIEFMLQSLCFSGWIVGVWRCGHWTKYEFQYEIWHKLTTCYQPLIFIEIWLAKWKKRAASCWIFDGFCLISLLSRINWLTTLVAHVYCIEWRKYNVFTYGCL